MKRIVAALMLIPVLSFGQGGLPQLPDDRPVAVPVSGATLLVVTDGGDVPYMANGGVFLNDMAALAIDAKFSAQARDVSRLSAENASLSDSLQKEALKPNASVVAVIIGVVVGVVVGGGSVLLLKK